MDSSSRLCKEVSRNRESAYRPQLTIILIPGTPKAGPCFYRPYGESVGFLLR